MFGILGALMLLTTLSAERAARSMSAQLGGFDGQLEKLGKQLEKGEELSPGEAGKALGEFLKGIE